MKKRTIVDLIASHYKKDEKQFRLLSEQIAREFRDSGDNDIAILLFELIDQIKGLTPQSIQVKTPQHQWLELIELHESTPLYLPEKIQTEVLKLQGAIKKNSNVTKFIFYGNPGTGKTETTKFIASNLGLPIYFINIPSLIDSKLGQSPKNIVSLFDEIRAVNSLKRSIFVFDEIDAIIMDRSDQRDIREMSRVTSTFLREMDKVDETAIILGTTNLYSKIESAVSRRFDLALDFDSYKQEDLRKICKLFFDDFAKKYSQKPVPPILLSAVLSQIYELPLPSQLKNLIKVSFAFSNDSISFDYLWEFYKRVSGLPSPSFNFLIEKKVPLRLIEEITGISRSTLSRKTKSER